MTDRSSQHWYPTAAYLYTLHLDGPALAWEYLRRNPSYRRDWLRRRRKPDAAQAWGLRLLEDPGLDARDAHPAWFPDHDAVVQLYPDADPPPDAHTFEFWRIPGRKQLTHDGKRLVLVSHWPGCCVRLALAPDLEDGSAISTPHAPAPRPVRATARSLRSWMRYLPQPWPRLWQQPAPAPRPPRCWNCIPCKRSTRPSREPPCARWAKVCSARMPSRPTGTKTVHCVPAYGGWYAAAMS